MIYPKRNLYRILYAKYFERKPEELLAFAGSLNGKKILDLCGGSGRVSQTALRLGASECKLVDRSLEMVPDNLDSRISVENVDIFIAFQSLNTKYDVAVCQQGINYWFSTNAIELLYESLVDGGIFVFNTFNQKPPTKPSVKKYNYEGKNYVEISWLVGKNKVHHVQICEFYEAHTTQFLWIPSCEFKEVLNPRFEITETKQGRTSIYRCVKK